MARRKRPPQATIQTHRVKPFIFSTSQVNVFVVASVSNPEREVIKDLPLIEGSYL
jgi:hypothetical protein